ncbi:MAG: DUF4350 domain-containing protein [Mycobacteriales bacterium]
MTGTAGRTGAEPLTASGPTVRSATRAARGPALVVAGVVLVGVVVGVLGATGSGGRLDPDAYSPAGARALATLLRDRGIPVERVETVEQVVAADDPAATVVVPAPQTLTGSELAGLGGLVAPLLVVGAEQAQLELLGLPVRAGPAVPVERRRPGCTLPLAGTAGEVDLGGPTYDAEGVPAAGCYAASGSATLLRLPSVGVTLLGDGTPLTNERLGHRGNAALALGLLGDADRVVWLVPRPGRTVPEGEQPPLSELVADELKLGALWLLVVGAVLALWRARRLGRVVGEPLPVVVRAAEAVEGRARLYHAAGARGTAAEALRAATRERLATRVGLPAGAEQAFVVALVAERTGSDRAVVGGLLYGGPPVDDAALVRLAGDLRILEQALTREVAGP